MTATDEPGSDAAGTERDHRGRALRHPVEGFRRWVGNGPVAALWALFALNAVDELTRTAFAVLSPDIAEDLGVGLAGIFTVVALVGVVALGLQVPIAGLADRSSRVRLAVVGGVVLAVFSTLVGVSPNIWFLGTFMAAAGLGRAFVDPTHNSLLTDYFAPDHRPRVFSFHRAANAVGQFVGPLTAGFIAFSFGWRAPFLVFGPVILAVTVVAWFVLHEPVRGRWEREAMGADEEVAATEEPPPSMAEAWRMCWKIDSLRRIYRTLPFLAPALIGFVSLASFLYREEFGLDERSRGVIASLTEPAQLVGLALGAAVGTRLFRKDPKLVFRFLGVVMFGVSVGAAAFALSPAWFVTIGDIRIPWVAALINGGISAALAFLLPGVLAALSMAIPPRSRSMGFSMASVFVLPGLVLLPIIGALGDAWGIRAGMLLMTPMFFAGGLSIRSAGTLIDRDIDDVWTTARARSEVLDERRRGRSKLLVARGIDVSYGDVQVLFGVDFEVDEGQIVALLGTNGAGKSTLLKALSGIAEADRGAVIFDGVEITHAPPHEIASKGIVGVPGGQGVFPSLTVEENLRAAAWLERRNRSVVSERIDGIYDTFPVLDRRRGEAAANLSGGQQQMLALGMALLSRPRLIMIDELSLGLAPLVVEQLVGIVREIASEGTTVIIVEQSVNVALTLADEAFFMEKGEIRFRGPTTELLDRPDVLRSVFLEGAAQGLAGTSPGEAPGSRPAGGGSAPAEGSAERAVTGGEEPEASRVDDGAGVSPPLELVGVTRSFGGIRAVDDVSFRVEAGEIVGLIGPNGAGKTTLMDIISGFDRAEAGRIRMSGVDVAEKPASQRSRAGLGRSFQDAALFPSLTVEQTVAVALECHLEVRDPIQAALWLPAAYDTEVAVRRRVDALIEMLGLTSFRSKFVHELSTGSRRIVDIACLVAHRPRIVLLDEPSSGIAQRETEALGPVIRSIRDDLGASVVVIEHDMPLITSVADRLIALDQGRVIASGPPLDVLARVEVVDSYLGNTRAVIERSGPLESR